MLDRSQEHRRHALPSVAQAAQQVLVEPPVQLAPPALQVLRVSQAAPIRAAVQPMAQTESQVLVVRQAPAASQVQAVQQVPVVHLELMASVRLELLDQRVQQVRVVHLAQQVRLETRVLPENLAQRDPADLSVQRVHRALSGRQVFRLATTGRSTTPQHKPIRLRARLAA